MQTVCAAFLLAQPSLLLLNADHTFFSFEPSFILILQNPTFAALLSTFAMSFIYLYNSIYLFKFSFD